MGKERESRTLLLLLRAVLIFSLLISGIVKEVGGEEIYIATTGIDELTCGSSTLPCATLLYVFSGSFPSLTDNSIIYLSPGSYNIQNLLLFPNNLTLTSTFPPLDGEVELTITGEGQNNEGIKVTGNALTLENLFFKNIQFIDNLIEISSPQISFSLTNCFFNNIHNVRYNLLLFNSSSSSFSSSFNYNNNNNNNDKKKKREMEGWDKSEIKITGIEMKYITVGVHVMQIEGGNVEVEGVKMEDSFCSSFLSILFAENLSINQITGNGITCYGNTMNLYGISSPSQSLSLSAFSFFNSQFTTLFSFNLLNQSEITMSEITLIDIQLMANHSQLISLDDGEGSISINSFTSNNMKESSGNQTSYLIDCTVQTLNFNNFSINYSPQTFFRLGTVETMAITNLIISNVNNNTNSDLLQTNYLFWAADSDHISLSNITFVNNYPFIQTDMFYLHSSSLSLSSFFANSSKVESLLFIILEGEGEVKDSYFHTGSQFNDITFALSTGASVNIENNVFYEDLSFYCGDDNDVTLTNNSFPSSSSSCPSFYSENCNLKNDCDNNNDNGNDGNIGEGIYWEFWILAFLAFFAVFVLIIILVTVFIFFKRRKPSYTSLDD